MISEYIKAAMNTATFEILDDKTFFGDIPALDGVYSNHPQLEKSRDQLQSVLEEWLIWQLRNDVQLPVIDGIDAKALLMKSENKGEKKNDSISHATR